MKKKFAFLLMGTHYDPKIDRASFETSKQVTYIETVNTMDEAVMKAVEITKDGVGAIELCGAFGEAGARKIIEATGGGVAVGYVTHFPEQDALFEAFFRKG